jgi:hypothetical protein
MISRRLVVLLAAFVSCSVLDEEFSDFLDSLSLEDSSLINVVSLSLEGDSVRLLDDASSELGRGCFGLALAFFVADGVTLFFFDADGSYLFLLLITLNPFSEHMAMDSMYLSCLVSTSSTLSRSSACMAKCPR